MLKYYVTEQVCDIVNNSLKLNVKESVTYSILKYWLQKGLIESMKTTEESGVHKYTPEQVDKILEVAFVRLKLGVEISYINSTLKYLKEKQVIFDYEKN